MDSGEASPRPRGPTSYENWRHFLDGLPHRGTFEVPFYTDARITGEIPHETVPYALLNTVPVDDGYGLLRPAIVLRYPFRVPYIEPAIHWARFAPYPLLAQDAVPLDAPLGDGATPGLEKRRSRTR